MRILITGSRGFIGGSVGLLAACAGHDVKGVGRSSQAEVGWPGGYVQADVATSDLSEAIKEFAPDVVLHAAGTASVSASFKAPLNDLRAAAFTWANTLNSVRRSGLKPLIVFPSSAAVYGNPTELPLREEIQMNPISPYGFHKVICELLAREYTECFGLNIIVCRLFSICGAAQRRLLVWELYEQFAGPSPTVWLQGTGTESRDYLHIDDVALALLQLIEAQVQSSNSDRCLIVNIASGEETNVLDLAKQIRNLVAPEKEIRCRGSIRSGDPPRWRADISRLRALIPHWRPQPLSLALAQCIATWQNRFVAKTAEGRRRA